MFQRRRARILLAVIAISAFVLVTLDFRSDDGALDELSSGLTTLFRPVQDGVATLVSPFGDAADRVAELFALRRENRELRARVEQLEERHSSLADLERENAEFRELLGMADRTELGTVAARTVALAPSNFEWTITIDVGEEDGIERGMPVIDGDGLVGRVIQVTPTASRVLLAIDPNFSAAARSARAGEIGTIDGRGGDPMLLSLLDPEAEVEEGDEVVTSSFDGGVFPAGIPIGTVREVLESEARLSRQVEVSPFVDFTRLHHVLVVQSTGVDELPPFEGTEDLDLVRPELGDQAEDAEGADDENGDTTDDADDDEGDDAEAGEAVGAGDHAGDHA